MSGAKRMRYEIAGRAFANKEEIKAACRAIRDATEIKEAVAAEHVPFLLALFEHHHEWSEKSAGGVAQIVVGYADHRTRCFYVVGAEDERLTDISFLVAVGDIPIA